MRAAVLFATGVGRVSHTHGESARLEFAAQIVAVRLPHARGERPMIGGAHRAERLLREGGDHAHR